MVFLNFSAILLFFLSELLKINHPHFIMTTKTSNPLNESEKAVSLPLYWIKFFPQFNRTEQLSDLPKKF